ncbi:hypothetical protein [Micromonospora mirobrigensis]|uniref:Uncharacterized protein n=1 Tax=Micromonospora mirobrigensis TaxID=262898 RepID=A0A1C4UQB6_9ACTN|nr:hypothetical protein [Micromonospora mirobrigensis]SCE73919.1 hypothetical protein GA0070564_101649 [Micromonospora mirobrigensis]
MDRADRATLAWLGHPLTVLALIVLVVNDHLLKAAQPSWLTGKLSDVAGLVVGPPLLAVLAALTVPRLPPRAAAGLGLGLVGAGFTVVKSSGYAATLASSAWSLVSGPSLVRADRTDLLALPALVIAAWTWRQARRDPVTGRSARLVRLLVLLPAATLAVAATSAYWYPDAQRAIVLDGNLAAGVGGSIGARTASPVETWRVSEDAGSNWREPLTTEQRPLGVDEGQLPPATPPPVRQACVPAEPRHCYRLVDGRLRVLESADAGRTWRTAWEVTEAQRAILIRRYAEAGWSGERVTGQELAILDVAGGRHVVLVANGRDGFVLRDAEGAWRRIGFAGARPDSSGRTVDLPALGVSTPAQRHADPVRVGLVAFLLSVLVLVVAGARAGWRRRTGPDGWQLAAVALFLAGGAPLSLFGVAGDDLTILFGCAVGVPLVLAAGLTSLLAARAAAPTRWTAEVLLAAALTLVLAALPLIGWLYGRPAFASAAVALAVLAALPGLGLAWRAGRLVTVRTAERPPPYPVPGARAGGPGFPSPAPLPPGQGVAAPAPPGSPASVQIVRPNVPFAAGAPPGPDGDPDRAARRPDPPAPRPGGPER